MKDKRIVLLQKIEKAKLGAHKTFALQALMTSLFYLEEKKALSRPIDEIFEQALKDFSKGL